MKDLICTNQIATTGNGIRYKVYKSVEDARFYIKRFNGIFEISISNNGKTWTPFPPLTGGNGVIENQ